MPRQLPPQILSPASVNHRPFLPGVILTPQHAQGQSVAGVVLSTPLRKCGYPTPKGGTAGTPLGNSGTLLFHANPLGTPGRASQSSQSPAKAEAQLRKATNLRIIEDITKHCNSRATPEPQEVNLRGTPATEDSGAEGASPSKRQRPKPPPLQDLTLTEDIGPSLINEGEPMASPSQPVASPLVSRTVIIGGRSPVLYFDQTNTRTLTPNAAANGPTVSFYRCSPTPCSQLGETAEALEFVGANRTIETPRPVTAPEQPTELEKAISTLRGKAGQVSKVGWTDRVKTLVNRAKARRSVTQSEPKLVSGAYVQTVSPNHVHRKRDLQWHKQLQDWGQCKSNCTVIHMVGAPQQQRALAQAQNAGRVEKWQTGGGWANVQVGELQACKQLVSRCQRQRRATQFQGQIEQVLQAALVQGDASPANAVFEAILPQNSPTHTQAVRAWA